MKTTLYMGIIIAALAMVPMLSCAVLAQGPAFDRNSCIRNCAWLRPYNYNYGQYMNYHNCMARCESLFWRQFDKDTRQLENKIK